MALLRHVPRRAAFSSPARRARPGPTEFGRPPAAPPCSGALPLRRALRADRAAEPAPGSLTSRRLNLAVSLGVFWFPSLSVATALKEAATASPLALVASAGCQFFVEALREALSY
ncbi:unnamed protein product, partial [Prorocentrum cordatum]